MQQELIEMLEKVVDHVVFCNGYDQRFSSTSYGVKILKEAGELVEKVKNNEPAVPQREPEAYMVYGNYTRQPFRSIESAQSYMGGLLKSDPEGGYHIRPLFYATPAAPSQTVACGLCQGSGVLGPTQKCICQYGGQEPVALTNGLIEKGAMTGMVDAQIDAIIAALREKEKSQ